MVDVPAPASIEPPSEAAMLECEEDRAVSAPTRNWLVRLAIAGQHYSVAGDGTVIAARTDVHASVDDYQTWQLSDAAVRIVTQALAGRDVAPHDDSFADAIHVELLSPCFGPTTNAWKLPADTILATVTDTEMRVTEPNRWQPDTLWIVVHPADRRGSPNDAADPFAAWPLTGGITDHVVGHSIYRTNSEEAVPVRWACLTGDNVIPVWELQQPGSRNTWIRLEDAEGQWEVTIKPTWPGYRSSMDPCTNDETCDSCDNVNTMRESLVRLLDALEAIGTHHEELYDTAVRERLGAVIEKVLVTEAEPIGVPDDFGMFSVAGNRLVGEALERYLAEVVPRAGAMGLDEDARRSAVWDGEAVSSEGTTVDEFLGWVY